MDTLNSWLQSFFGWCSSMLVAGLHNPEVIGAIVTVAIVACVLLIFMDA